MTFSWEEVVSHVSVHVGVDHNIDHHDINPENRDDVTISSLIIPVILVLPSASSGCVWV